MTLKQKYLSLDTDRRKANIGRFLAYAAIYSPEELSFFKSEHTALFAPMQDDITG